MKQRQHSIGLGFASVAGLLLVAAAGCSGGSSPPSLSVVNEGILQQGCFVIVTGDDSDDFGHGAEDGYGNLFRNLFSKALAESKTGGDGILSIGSNSGDARSSFNSWRPGGTNFTITDSAGHLPVDFSA